MIMSVSTLIILSGAATPSSTVNLSTSRLLRPPAYPACVPVHGGRASFGQAEQPALRRCSAERTINFQGGRDEGSSCWRDIGSHGSGERAGSGPGVMVRGRHELAQLRF